MQQPTSKDRRMIIRNVLRGLTSIAVGLVIALHCVHADEPLPRGHFKLTGVKVVPVERTKVDGKINDHESDKLTYWIRFDVHPKFELVKGTETLPWMIVNPTVGAKSRLSFDKPVKFKGKEVPAGANLLEYKKFDGSFFNVHMPDPFPLAIHSARIMRDFEIPADTYVVQFEWTTKDGDAISDSVKVHIDVDLP